MLKIAALLLLGSFFVLPANGQMLIGAGLEEINVPTLLTQVPEMPVTDAAGNKSTLKTYLRQNQLHPGKPTVIVTWFSFCIDCKRQFDMIVEKGLADQYNVVTILIQIVARDKADAIDLNAEIKKDNSDRDWNKFLNLVVDQKMAERYLYCSQSTPLYIIADAKMNVHNTHKSLHPDMVTAAEKFLKHLDGFTGKFTPGMRWLDANDLPVPAGSPEAVRYSHTYKNGELIKMIKASLTDSSKSISQYVNADSFYLAEGRWQSFDSTGKLIRSRAYHKGGLSETVRTTYANGKPESIIPVNGIAKTFDENGKLTMEGNMKNGLGEGVYKLYEDGVLTDEISLKAGVYDGPYKVYKNGVLKSETVYQNGRKVQE